MTRFQTQQLAKPSEPPSSIEGAVKKPSAQERPFVLAGIARYVAGVARILTALVLGLDPHGLRYCPEDHPGYTAA
jgi:hypothetical protein